VDSSFERPAPFVDLFIEPTIVVDGVVVIEELDVFGDPLLLTIPFFFFLRCSG